MISAAQAGELVQQAQKIVIVQDGSGDIRWWIAGVIVPLVIGGLVPWYLHRKRRNENR